MARFQLESEIKLGWYGKKRRGRNVDCATQRRKLGNTYGRSVGIGSWGERKLAEGDGYWGKKGRGRHG